MPTNIAEFSIGAVRVKQGAGFGVGFGEIALIEGLGSACLKGNLSQPRHRPGNRGNGETRGTG
ncbi:MAG: hypothetical protein UZ07_CHB004000305, partial [Chlorobi bacterium OLB7]